MQDLAHCLPVRPGGVRPWPVQTPPQIPVHAGSGRVTLDLRPLLAGTTTSGSPVFGMSAGRQPLPGNAVADRAPRPGGVREIEVFGDYPGSSVLLRRPSACSQMGSYNAFIHFNERSRRHRQTVSTLPSNSAWPANLATGCCSTNDLPGTTQRRGAAERAMNDRFGRGRSSLPSPSPCPRAATCTWCRLRPRLA